MPSELVAIYLNLPVFGLVVARLAGLLMFQPILGGLGVPVMIRALMIAGLAALVTPLVPTPAGLPETLGGLTLALGGELLVGALVGLLALMLFVGLQMGATLIAQESGLAYGQVVDPTTAEEQSVLSVFYMQLAAVVFLIVGGHRLLLSACLDTFQCVPLLAPANAADGALSLLTDAVQAGGVLALRVAAPAVVTMFLINVALGFVARTVPQLNVTLLGFSFKGLVGFLMMAVSLPAAMTAFTGGLDALVASVHLWLNS